MVEMVTQKIPTNEHMRSHETLMLRTTTTSTPLVQAESQSQSSVAVSAPITTQIAEPEPTPMDIVSEPVSKVSELIPTTETEHRYDLDNRMRRTV